MTTHLTRQIPRPLRQGDRVKDKLHTPFRDIPAPFRGNYPGAHAYGTVIAGPRRLSHAFLYHVRFDDHIAGWVDERELERL